MSTPTHSSPINYSALLSLVGVCICLTILFLSMRAVMGVGGTCAEGGPYAIEVHCPGATAWLTPLSIIVGMILAGWYSISSIAKGPNVTLLFWPGLFLSLGWNFFEFGLGFQGTGLVIGWIICGVMFWIMGGAPLLLLSSKEQLVATFIGTPVEDGTSPDMLFAVLHALAIPLGIGLGWWVFMTL